MSKIVSELLQGIAEVLTHRYILFIKGLQPCHCVKILGNQEKSFYMLCNLYNKNIWSLRAIKDQRKWRHFIAKMLNIKNFRKHLQYVSMSFPIL